MPVQELTPLELKALLDKGAPLSLIDVREPEEHELVKIKGSILIPLMEIESRIEELKKLCDPKNGEIVFYCRAGSRSDMAIQYLQSLGFGSHLKNLRGGINAYANEADSSLEPY